MCQHHAGLHKNQHSQHRPGPSNRLGEISSCERCPATEARCAQPEMPELAQSSLLSWSLVTVQHPHTISISGLFHSTLNLLKVPMVYLNKATTSIYTFIAKAMSLVTQYTLLSLQEKMGKLGYTCYFINHHLLCNRTHLLSFCFSSQQALQKAMHLASHGCLRCSEPEKTGIHLQLGLQELRARLKHTPLNR